MAAHLGRLTALALATAALLLPVTSAVPSQWIPQPGTVLEDPSSVLSCTLGRTCILLGAGTRGIHDQTCQCYPEIAYEAWGTHYALVTPGQGFVQTNMGGFDSCAFGPASKCDTHALSPTHSNVRRGQIWTASGQTVSPEGVSHAEITRTT